MSTNNAKGMALEVHDCYCVHKSGLLEGFRTKGVLCGGNSLNEETLYMSVSIKDGLLEGCI